MDDRSSRALYEGSPESKEVRIPEYSGVPEFWIVYGRCHKIREKRNKIQV
jgi:hypothetical protein